MANLPLINQLFSYKNLKAMIKNTVLAILFFTLLALSNNLVQATSFNNTAQQLSDVNINEVKSGQLLFKQNNNSRFLQAPLLKTQAFIDIKGIVANTKVLQTFTNTTDQWQHALYVFPLPDDAAVNELLIVLGERKIIGVVKEKAAAQKTFEAAKKAGKKAALVEQLRPNLFTMQIANIPPHESIAVELSYFQQVQFSANTFSLHFPMAITPRYTPVNTTSENVISKGINEENTLMAGSRFIPEPNIPNLLFKQAGQQNVHAATNTSASELENSLATKLSKIDLTVSLNSGSALLNLKSLNHSMMIKQQGEGLFNLQLSDHPLDQDFELVWQYQAQALPKVINFSETYQVKNTDETIENYGLLMVIPGLAKAAKPLARQLTFILDKSGSMAGQSIAQAKQAFEHALKTLDEHDTFQLITFNNVAEAFFEKPVAATAFNKQTAWRFVAGLEANGGTEIKTALQLTLLPEFQHGEQNNTGRLQQIVFLTDGAVGNEAEIFTMINEHIADYRLFTVGLGTAPNRYFMKRAAEVGRGSYQFIGSHRELVPEMDKLFNKLDQPNLTDIKLTLNDTSKIFTSSPNPIADVYADEPIFISYKLTEQQNILKSSRSETTQAMLTANYQGKPWQLPLTINTTTISTIETNKTIATKKTIEQPQFTGKIPALATLWARRKIDDYYQKLMLHRDNSAKNSIIDLALNFNLVTPFTSLVAVEEVISRPENDTKNIMADTAVNNKQLTNNLPAGQKMPRTALNLTSQLWFAMALLILAILATLLITVPCLRIKVYVRNF